MPKLSLRLCAAMAWPLLVPTQILAQDAVPEPEPALTPNADAAKITAGAKIYLPADFARFSPLSALDMVGQIPGFSIEGGDDGNRGLGQAKENVLINGQRISGKNTGVVDRLSQISATAVVRIEIVDGATLNIAGLSGEVANVITKPDRFSGQFRWSPEFRPRIADNWLSGEISISGKLGSTDYTLALANNSFRHGNRGPDSVSDPSGNEVLRRAKFNTVFADSPGLKGSISRKAKNGNVLNINAGGNLFHFDGLSKAQEIRAGVRTATEVDTDKEREWNGELGGDYEFALGKGRLKIIGLQRMEHSPYENLFTRTDLVNGNTISGGAFNRVADESESIIRSEYKWRTSGGTDWQIALEGAYNVLDIESELFSLSPTGALIPIPFPGSTAKVDEKRAEFIGTWGRTIGPNMTLQINAGAEYSQISQSGVGGQTRSFIRPKGKMAFSWKKSPKLTFNATVERRVDQLRFFDFIASVDLANNVDTASNPDLVPPQRWRATAEFVRNMGKWGSATVGVRAAYITDIVDVVPVSATAEAVGNLPKAYALLAEGKGTILFDPIGWKGAKLDFSTIAARSFLEDPVTGQTRYISGDTKFLLEMNLRQDIPNSKVAWGVGFFRNLNAANFRLGERDYGYESRPFMSIYLEHKDVLGMTASVSLRNLLDSRDGRNRDIYVDRRDGPLAFRDYRLREFGRIVSVNLSGKF